MRVCSPLSAADQRSYELGNSTPMTQLGAHLGGLKCQSTPNGLRSSRRGTGSRGCISSIALVLLTTLFLSFVSATRADEPKRVLILMQEDLTWPIFRLMDENIRASLRDGLPGGVLIFSEHLDREHFLDSAIQAEQISWIKKKYAKSNLDLVISVGDVPTDLFPGVPLVFVNADPRRKLPRSTTSGTRSASVWVSLDAQKTLELARRLQPSARRIVIIGEDSPSEDNILNTLRRELSATGSDIPITYLTNRVVPEICQKVSELGADSIVLFTSLAQDERGRPLISAEVIPRIAAASAAPVYVILDTHVGTGAVGGYVAKFAEVGKAGGQQGLRILAGEQPQDVVAPNGYLFDWRQLRRWKISESALPSGSVVLYRDPSSWEHFRNYFLGGMALLILQTLLIVGLLKQRADRRAVGRSLVASNAELKRSEALLRESEGRFRRVANTAPVLIWMSGSDKHCIFFNQGWLSFTGRSLEQELGEGWVSGVHPDDLENCLGIYSAAFDARAGFEREYRLSRFDGQYRWILDFGTPRFESDGAFCGYIGSCVDISERKLSEESLQNLSGRLIRAQEEERSRIARELHDDFSQRMALQGIGLAQLWKRLPESEVEERARVWEMQTRSQEMTDDMHSLSHQLHSSKLELVGLVSALSGLCAEIGEKFKIDIQFSDCELPFRIPKDVALCLFRVTQEALGNVVKHSRAKSAQVELGANESGISLRIMDAGRGFEPDLSNTHAGIGLAGMRERLRLVGGRLSVSSGPLRGTEILAEVPLSTFANETQASIQAARGREP
jgi:PAS domain S-box-containing protein